MLARHSIIAETSSSTATITITSFSSGSATTPSSAVTTIVPSTEASSSFLPSITSSPSSVISSPSSITSAFDLFFTFQDCVTKLEWKPSLDSFHFGSFGLQSPFGVSKLSGCEEDKEVEHYVSTSAPIFIGEIKAKLGDYVASEAFGFGDNLLPRCVFSKLFLQNVDLMALLDSSSPRRNISIPVFGVSRFLKLEKSPSFRWLLQFSGTKECLLTDNPFLVKVAMECGVGTFTKTAAEDDRKRENLFKELWIVFTEVVMAKEEENAISFKFEFPRDALLDSGWLHSWQNHDVFEISISMDGQTRVHALVAFMICFCNKMDVITPKVRKVISIERDAHFLFDEMATWKISPALAAGSAAILKLFELAYVTCLERVVSYETSIKDSFSSILEIASNNVFEDFKLTIDRDGSLINEVDLWYVRQNVSKQIVLEHRTPLMVAATYGSIDFLKLILLCPEADVNFSYGTDKSIALHCTASSGVVNAVDIVKLLLSPGADISCVDANGNLPLDVIVVPPKLQGMKTMLEEFLSYCVFDGSVNDCSHPVSANSSSPGLAAILSSLDNGLPSSPVAPKCTDTAFNSASDKKEYPIDHIDTCSEDGFLNLLTDGYDYHGGGNVFCILA
ncbi:Protein RETICULATA-related [Sesbania bispinosa]|nr:Protein RETICULATA-related [Sesbania bispinosa]